MEITAKKLNIWSSNLVPAEKPESVQFLIDDEFLFEDAPGSEIEARIAGFLEALDFLGKDVSFVIEDEYD